MTSKPKPILTIVCSAQIKMIAELGNPFKEESESC